eukprot:8873138-Alexandrium_andersonii.AAC.1
MVKWEGLAHQFSRKGGDDERKQWKDDHRKAVASHMDFAGPTQSGAMKTRALAMGLTEREAEVFAFNVYKNHHK